MKTFRHLLNAGIAGTVLAVVVAIPAFAHAELVSSTPEDGAVLTVPPTTIELTFSEGLSASKSTFRVSGPDGAVGTGRPEKDGSEVMTLDGLVLGPGGYTIRWTSAAEDGHLERGTLSFTVAAVPSAPPSPTPTAPPSASAGVSAAPASSAPASSAPASTAPVSQAPASPTPGPTAPPAAPAASSGTDVLLPIVVALLLVGGVGAFVLRRGRRA